MSFPVVHLGQSGEIFLGHLLFLGHSFASSFPPHSTLWEGGNDREVLLADRKKGTH